MKAIQTREIEETPRLTIDDFLSLIEKDSCNLDCRYGVLHVSSDAVGVLWKGQEQDGWKMIHGEAVDVDEAAESVPAQKLVDYVNDIPRFVHCGGGAVSFIPNAYLADESFTVMISGLPGTTEDSILHCDDELGSVLEKNRNARLAH